METKDVLFSKPYLDIVFENRNQAYGAYQLRQEYARNVAIGIFVMLATIVALLSASFAYDYFHVVKPLQFTSGKHTITEVILPKEKIEVIVEPQVKKGSLPKQVVDNPTMRVVQNTTQEMNRDSIREEQILAYVDNGEQGEVGVPNGVENGTTTIPNLVPVASTPPTAPVAWAEVMPEFIGGENAMMAFIRNNVEYPTVERENGISGTAIVSFVVNEDGSVSDVKGVKSTTRNFQKASEAVVSSFPKFKPGMQGDKPVKVRLTIPIKFVTD